MDDIDQQLISLLRQDARMSIGDLAHKLKVSRGTVNNRLRKLEDSQVIVGYTIKLRPDAEPETIKAWMGGTHFLMRRLKNVRSEMALNVLAYNIKRMVALVGIRGLMRAMQG